MPFVGARLLIGLAVAMAQFFAAVRTASKKPAASSRNACVLTLNDDSAETRPMLTEPEKESAGIPGTWLLRV